MFGSPSRESSDEGNEQQTSGTGYNPPDDSLLQRRAVPPGDEAMKQGPTKREGCPKREHLEVKEVLGLIDTWLGWLEAGSFTRNPLAAHAPSENP